MTADVSALRPRLFGIAYRVLGSIADAEDVVQNAYVRYEEHRDEDLRNPGGWLATVTARLAIDRARSLSRRREEYFGTWLPEPLVESADTEDPYASVTYADDLAMGFLHVLERLRPEERTAMLLHDVFDYSHAEVAAMLGKSEVAVRQLVSRARVRVRADRPRIAVDRQKADELIDRMLSALHDGNVAELETIFTADVTAISDGGGKVSAAVEPVVGSERVIRGFIGVYRKFWSSLTMRRLLVNGLPGLGLWRGEKPAVVVAFDFSEDKISKIYSVLNPEKLERIYRDHPG
ncbi:MAG TPA: RNA polymerase sigma factor SigJ [Candidatus Baltobacteraceae bacterium]|jgi:RNA polymerase sigma-70 factor (ECF subfamily)|nr:RNA polymerase sigma factor SigJ [Candidatus Baltobacteraceae bacterium]